MQTGTSMHCMPCISPITCLCPLQIQCTKCQFVWCFKCQAPWHDGLKCREYRKGDKLLRHWASVIEHGQRNAQKCPRCKVSDRAWRVYKNSKPFSLREI